MPLIIKSEQNIFKTKFTTLGSFITILLTITVLALSERILYDVARLIASPPLDYFDNISVIVLHAFTVITFLIFALIINFSLGQRKEKYAIALIPYFFVSIFLAMQLILQISIYFYNHHTDAQFYIVMTTLVVVTTYAIYYIQDRFSPQV